MKAETRSRVLVALRPDGREPPDLVAKAGNSADFHFVRSADEVDAVGESAEVALVWNFRSSLIPDAIGRMRRLKWVHVAASGIDASLSEEVKDRHVTFTNSRGVTADAMAEYALALMLAVAKDLPMTFRNQCERRWSPRLSGMLAGRTLVAVGVGAVGSALARRANALGMRVIGVGRSARSGGEGFERIEAVGDLQRVLGEADYVVLATPLTAETTGLIGEAELHALKPNAVLVNLGRGAVIHEDDLLSALRQTRLRAACLDVFGSEPLPSEHPLWDMPQVIVSPHMSSDFVGWEESMVDLFIRNLALWRAGMPLVNVVDLTLGYAPSRTAAEVQS